MRKTWMCQGVSRPWSVNFFHLNHNDLVRNFSNMLLTRVLLVGRGTQANLNLARNYRMGPNFNHHFSLGMRYWKSVWSFSLITVERQGFSYKYQECSQNLGAWHDPHIMRLSLIFLHIQFIALALLLVAKFLPKKLDSPLTCGHSTFFLCQGCFSLLSPGFKLNPWFILLQKFLLHFSFLNTKPLFFSFFLNPLHDLFNNCMQIYNGKGLLRSIEQASKPYIHSSMLARF